MTTIQWTNETWNPIRARNRETGGVGHFCVKVDPACKNCYAEPYQARVKNPIRFAAQDLALVEPFLDDAVLKNPLGMRAPRMIFPCSMTDLFADFHPDEWIDRVVAVAALTPRHTYQVLTKRSERMHKYWTLWPDGSGRVNHVFVAAMHILEEMGVKRDDAIKRAQQACDVKTWPPKNWWQGVSVGTQLGAEERITNLLRTHLHMHWVSAEPILEYVDLTCIAGRLPMHPATHDHYNALYPYATRRLDWVVVGGESGPRARVTNVDAIRRVVRDCQTHQVPVFVKQLGARPQIGAPYIYYRPVDPKGGEPAEWPEDLRVREWPKAA